MKYFDCDNPKWRVVLAYPIQAIAENPPRGWLVGAGLGLLQWIAANQIVWIALLLAVVLGFIDQRAGEKLARRNNEYNPLTADAGMYGKFLGIPLALALWPFERIIVHMGGPDLRGMLPTAVAAWIAWHEYESIHEKYQKFGRPPIPVISQVNALLRKLGDALFNSSAPKV